MDPEPPKSKVIPNEPRYVKVGDYGIRMAKRGYDASTCSNSQLVFNSNWPIMQVAKAVDLSQKAEKIEETPLPPADFEPVGEPFDEVNYDSPYRPAYGRLAVDNSYVYTRVSAQAYQNKDWEVRYRYTTYGFPHGLGFTPLFILSEEISKTKGYALLLSVDISKDIDYPYRDAPSDYLGETHDYGLTTKNRLGDSMIDANTQSKLVQAVKTLETSKTERKESVNGGITFREVVWTPDKDANFSANITDYEFYGFISPFPTAEKFGPIYVQALASPQASGGILFDGNKVRLVVDGNIIKHASITALRAPMFSPLIEEVIYE